jgi:hypothetical protein
LNRSFHRALAKFSKTVTAGIFTAQYEHTIVITEGAPLIMTLPA